MNLKLGRATFLHYPGRLNLVIQALHSRELSLAGREVGDFKREIPHCCWL